jgi:SAM-dependent methyltransferase
LSKLSLKVSEERWKQAQEFELNSWRRQNRWLQPLAYLITRRTYHKPGDDWNHWWAQHFDNYRFLPQTMHDAVELGCGPYTNIRLMLERCQMDHVFCSDPLAKHYTTLRYSWLKKALKQKLIVIDDHPIEDCPFRDDFFDLVVLINVLDHVRDAVLCLQQAIRITKPGGIIIVGQDLTNVEDSIKTGDDVGHPIRMEAQDLDRQLLPVFAPHIHNVLPREVGRNPDAHYGTYLFSGTKSRTPQSSTNS